MNAANNDYRKIIRDLMLKSGMFSESDLQEIMNIPWQDLLEILDTTVKKNHFRTKFFYSQHDLSSAVEKSSQELYAMILKYKKMNSQKKKAKIPIHGILPVDDDRLNFLENIANATSQQMQQVLEEGIRRGVSMEEQARQASVVAQLDLGSIDENFGELPGVQLPTLPTVDSIRSLLNFRPSVSSTPLGASAIPVRNPDLEMILEEEPMPPPPHRLSQSALDPKQGAEAIIPQERLSQHTPRIPHPAINTRAVSSDRRVIPFNIDEPPKEQESQVPQEPPTVDNNQPDFPALRVEAINRHISSPTRTPQRRVRAARKAPKILELWTFRTQPLAEMTEGRLQRFLAPTLILPRPHIYLRPEIEEQKSSSSVPKVLHSSRKILQQSSSLNLPSTSREGDASVPLPIVPEVESLPPKVQGLTLQEISGVPETTGNISGIAPIPHEIVQNSTEDASVPQTHPNLPTIPEEDTPTRQNVPPVSPIKVTVPQKEKITRILKMVHLKKEIFKRDLKEEFPDMIQLVGAIRILLEFNGILWTLVSDQNNEFISAKELKLRKKK